MASDFSEKLRLLCSDYRSISEVCRRLGFNRQQFDRYLTGEVQPSQHNLRRIAQGFGVSIDELLDPGREIEKRAKPSALTGASRASELIDKTFPGDIKKLRALLGYHHMYFLAPDAQGSVIRSLIYLYEHEGKICSKTIERTRTGDEERELLKFEGLVSYLGNCIFLVEFETLAADTIVESILFPSYRKKLSILTGLTFGMTSEVYRQPFASPIAWKYLGNTVDVKEQLQLCGSYPIDDVRIDPRIRKYLQAKGAASMLSFNP